MAVRPWLAWTAYGMREVAGHLRHALDARPSRMTAEAITGELRAARGRRRTDLAAEMRRRYILGER